MSLLAGKKTEIAVILGGVFVVATTFYPPVAKYLTDDVKQAIIQLVTLASVAFVGMRVKRTAKGGK